MQCNSCGSTLPPEARHCPACGAPVYIPGPYQESVLPAFQPDRIVLAGSSNPAPLQEEAPLPPAFHSDMTLPTAANIPPSPLPNEYGQPSYAPPPYYANSQQPGYTIQQPPLPPPVQGSRGLSKGMITLLIILALLIMSSGVGLIYYSTIYRPAQLHAQATATVQTFQTREAQATALANSQATGTAVAFAKATATAQAVATAQVQATATVLQNIYTSATAGSPALNDALSGNTGSGWDEDQAQGGGGCAFTGGAYHASLLTTGFYFPCIAHNTNFSNFAFQVQMTITKGDAGGLLFRGNSSASKYYVFRLQSNGTYDLFISQDSTHSLELSYGTSPAIKKYAGQTNLLAVVARGNNLYLYINKQFIGNVSDSTYKAGQIGVFVEDRTNPTDVAYSNAQVWKL